MNHVSTSLEETKSIAEGLLSTLSPGTTATVVALSGDLGAGKTALSQMIGQILGVSDAMQSPTFVIMKIYALEGKQWDKLVHIDAYRLETEAELVHLGWKELIADPKNLILIEWPERVEGSIPKDAYKIALRFVDESTREITYGS